MTWTTLLISLIPVGILLVGFVPVFGFLYFWFGREFRRNQFSPLTRAYMRPPGYSLRSRTFKELFEVIFLCTTIILLPLFIYSIEASVALFQGWAVVLQRVLFVPIVTIALIGYLLFQLNKRLRNLKALILGQDGELATGEELNQLMLHGCRVFHDVPFPYGNIDHVVVSQSGVYAVETKVVTKLRQGDRRADVVVDHTTSRIQFPDREIAIPVDQCESQIRWLKGELSASVGEPIDVESILALPGWFIKERKGRGSVFVINPRNPRSFFVRSRVLLDQTLIQRVAHQLEQLCRLSDSHSDERAPL